MHSVLVLTLAIVAAGPAGAAPQESRSAAAARELAQLLAAKQITAIAAKDPDAPNRYVAALCYPGVQLLVVSAPYPDGAVLDDLIARRDFQTVYGTLQSPTIREGKVFVQDMGADGLTADGDATVDVLYEEVATQTMFDGNARGKGGAAYRQKFAAADAQYTKMLGVLLAQARQLSATH